MEEWGNVSACVNDWVKDNKEKVGINCQVFQRRHVTDVIQRLESHFLCMYNTKCLLTPYHHIPQAQSFFPHTRTLLVTGMSSSDSTWIWTLEIYTPVFLALKNQPSLDRCMQLSLLLSRNLRAGSEPTEKVTIIWKHNTMMCYLSEEDKVIHILSMYKSKYTYANRANSIKPGNRRVLIV